MPDVERFDLVVLGAGPAGEKGAALGAYFGRRVALVERRGSPGGASVHTGTLPSKTLREAALYLTGFRRRELYGMTLRLDRKRSLRQLLGRLADVTARQTRQIDRNLERHRIEVVTGQARFLDAGTVAVHDAKGGEIRRLSAGAFLIATGSSPLPPRGLTFDDPDVEDSDRILDLDRIPRSLAVVGGGVIGCEYACIFAALGTHVTLIEGRDRLLGFLDAELSAALEVSLRRMGAEVILGDAVEHLARVPGLSEDALRVKLKSGREVVAGKVLFSAGRRGNTEGLGLEAAGVAFDEKGRIPVDATFLTNVPGIYAAGDIVGFPALAATSMEQGRTAAKNALGLAGPDDRKLPFPYGVYTIPEISMIGSTEEELREKGTPYEVGRARYENNARGQINGDVDGFVKLLFDPDTKRLLGAHLLGTNATELVHVPQMVLVHGGGLADFLDAVFNVPTLSECFKYAAYDGLQRLSHRGRGVPVEVAAPLAAGQVLAPGARAWFAGVDLIDLSAPSPRPVDVAFMDRWRRVRFEKWNFAQDGAGLLPEGILADGVVVAIDGPQGLASPGRKVREGERELRCAGKTPDTLPAPGAGPYAGFLRGSVLLFSALRARGLGVFGEVPENQAVLLEVYPADLWKKWAGRALPKKQTPEGRRERWELLRGQGLELPLDAAGITHDQLDAAAAALAAYLWATGRTNAWGEAPRWDEAAGTLREGFVVSL
ncbi:MAG: Si-specific NAD(P)(+) transhydrogenase [Holophagales bacterium]|nr:Si-specific NAD(P)(+) transhydrogenase [Holophagales bacterium]